MLNQFFGSKLANFVEKDHVCACNICCLDIESIKKKAADDAIASLGDLKPATGQEGNALEAASSEAVLESSKGRADPSADTYRSNKSVG